MDKKELLRELKKRKDCKDIALEILGKEAKEWFDYRQKSDFTRLVDPDTGKWMSEFEAGGNKYFVRSPDDGIGLLRYTKLKQFFSKVGFDASYPDQMANLNKIVEYANKLGSKEQDLSEMFRAIDNMREAIKRSDRQWDFSFMAATLFIVRKGEDLTAWNEQEAEEKIKDWNKAGWHEYDFFLLVIFWGSLLSQRSQKSFQQMKKIAEQVR